MACNTITYYLEVDSVVTQVFPIWTASNNIEEVKENDQWFARKRLTGEFTFKKEDYDLIFAQNINTEFIMTLKDNGVDEGITAKFTRSDLIINEDEKEITVTPVSGDIYDLLISSLDREFNLPDICPTTPLNYKFRALLQVYVLGRPVIANYLGGNYWETEVAAEFDENELINTYKFGKIGWRIISPGNTHDFFGVNFIEHPTLTVAAWVSIDGRYLISSNSFNGVAHWAIRDLIGGGTGTLIYKATEPRGTTETPFGEFNPIGDVGFTFEKISDPSITCQFFGGEFYARILNDYTGGVFQVEPLPIDDITESNYSNSYPIDDLKIIAAWNNIPDVTQFGQIDENALVAANQYFAQPIENVFPVNRSEWTNVSFWVEKTAVLDQLEFNLSRDIQTQDAYTFYDVINSLLQEIDPIISHDQNDSVFLYQNRTPLIAPLSNIVFGDYDQPAKKANIKFSEVLNLLKIYNCGWHIEGGKFKIEHVSYYRNGMSYAGVNIGADLTDLIEPKNEKAWDTNGRVYQYEKENLFEEMRIKYRQTVSDAFEGFPLLVKANYIQKGSTLELNAGQFLTDIDFILSQSVSNLRGFFWGEAIAGSNGLVLPVISVVASPTEIYSLQNGYLSNIYLTYNNWLDNLPAEDIEINREALTALSVKRFRTQNLEVGAVEDFDIMRLVKTSIGDGMPMSKVKNLESKTLQLKINYDAV